MRTQNAGWNKRDQSWWQTNRVTNYWHIIHHIQLLMFYDEICFLPPPFSHKVYNSSEGKFLVNKFGFMRELGVRLVQGICIFAVDLKPNLLLTPS